MLNPGEIFAGRYRVEGLLGRGGMSAVYRAFDQLAQEPVALKVISPSLASQPLLLDKFKQELSIARRMTHPGVVRIHDIGEHGGVLFISMELVDGRSLAEELRLRGKFQPAEWRPLLEQFLAAMQHIHEQRIIHRDIKPANLMLKPDGVLKVMDFGIARDLSSDRTIGVPMGTAGYAAPETMAGEASFASDVFSTGAMTYELLVGQKPALVPDLRATGLPDVWVDLIARCMQIDASARPQTMVEVQRLLTRVEGSLAGRAWTDVMKPQPPAPTSPVRMGIRWGAAAAVLVGAAFVLFRVLSTAPKTVEGPGRLTPVETAAPVLVTRTSRMLLVPRSSFTMGTDDGYVNEKQGHRNEAPAHPVTVEAYYLDEREVLLGEYKPYLKEWGLPEGEHLSGEADDWPAYYVSWERARDFCAAQGKRLPTEAEWEFAAAGGRRTVRPEPFSAKDAQDRSKLGFLNMVSNVVEWVADEYRFYAGNPYPFPAAEKGWRVFRGAGLGNKDPLRWNPVTIRFAAPPDKHKYAIGFRCAASATETGKVVRP